MNPGNVNRLLTRLHQRPSPALTYQLVLAFLRLPPRPTSWGVSSGPRAVGTLASEVLDRLDGMEFSERQNLIALLDVRVDLESDGRISAFLSAPKPGDLGPDKVFSYTFSQDCSETYRDGPVRYEFAITVSSGTEISVVPTKPKGSWSRRFDACVECGTRSRPHASHGLCSRCFARIYARGRRGSDGATITNGSVKLPS